MQIQIRDSGLLSTIQGLGRWDYLADGVPLSGAMDTLAARAANAALGNPENEALIEFTYGGASFQATRDLLIAYAGGGVILVADQQKLPANRPLFIPSGTFIQLAPEPQSYGCRIYLAVAGGWDISRVLGDVSTYLPASFGGFAGRPLQTGDRLQAKEENSSLTKKIRSALQAKTINFPNWSIALHSFISPNRTIIRIIPAREFTWFQGSSLVDLLSSPYTVNRNSNRMGYHLDGMAMKRFIKDELLSTAVAPGTIQVSGEGKLILLMADSQTVGGYPRIAQVAAVDLPLCGQLKPGDQVYFTEISRKDAEKLYLKREKLWKGLTTAIAYKFT